MWETYFYVDRVWIIVVHSSSQISFYVKLLVCTNFQLFETRLKNFCQSNPYFSQQFRILQYNYSGILGYN